MRKADHVRAVSEAARCHAGRWYPVRVVRHARCVSRLHQGERSLPVHRRHPKRRWVRYEARIEHAAKVLREADADIVALQEVRHDDSFGPPGSAGTSASSQMRHLADRLPEYQYVYHPAMLYFDKGKPTGQLGQGCGCGCSGCI